MEYVTKGNKYYDEKTPWILVKEDIDKFNDVTYTCTYMIANIKNLLSPFLPDSSEKIKNMLDLDEIKWEEEVPSGDIKIKSVDLLFQRIEHK